MFGSLMSVDAAAVMKIEEFVSFICVVTLCAGALTLVYRHITPSDQDEREFASTIFILTVAIGLLVSIIKSAPAISFGLFGAMSIVRFRAQIKRPQRMIFIFMAAAIGVCCGAGQYLTTVMGTLVLSVLTLASFNLAPAKVKGKSKPVANDTAVTPAESTGATRGATWGVDLLPATLADGQRYRVLLVIDETSREVLAAVPETSFSGARVAGELDRLIAERGRPQRVISEAWPQLTAKALLDWNKTTDVEWTWLDDVKEPAPRIIIAANELRDRCLTGLDYATLLQARTALEGWRSDHNQKLGSEAGRAERGSVPATPRLAVKSPREMAGGLTSDTVQSVASATAMLAPVAREQADGPAVNAAVEAFAPRSKTSAGH